jgi:hypothetical protein
MNKLTIPKLLKKEFQTVEAVWLSGAETLRVDSLLLSWVKYEKQLRRLFSFLVFQHPAFTKKEIDEIISLMAERYDLTPEVFHMAIDRLGIVTIETLVGATYSQRLSEMQRIRKIRNKLMHGQITGLGIPSSQLEQDVLHVIQWISGVAIGAEKAFGYDGLRRNTFIHAKTATPLAVSKYPFAKVNELQNWLEMVIKETKKARRKAV